jgi:hypothetical protein
LEQEQKFVKDSFSWKAHLSLGKSFFIFSLLRLAWVSSMFCSNSNLFAVYIL